MPPAKTISANWADEGAASYDCCQRKRFKAGDLAASMSQALSCALAAFPGEVCPTGSNASLNFASAMAKFVSSIPCSNWQPARTTPALTTVYTPPPICSTRFTAGLYDANNPGNPALDAVQDNWDPVWYSCIPDEYDTRECPYLTFSPGIFCPHGWTATSTAVNGAITTATCCMSGFTVFASTKNYVQCVKTTSNFEVTRRDSTDAPSTDEHSIVMKTGTLDHRGWVIMWESSDIAQTSTRSSNAASSSRTEASSGADPQDRPPAISDNISDGGSGTSLSGGVIAAIALGALAALLLGILAGFLLRRYRKKREAPETHNFGFQDKTEGDFNSKTYSSTSSSRGGVYEVGGDQPWERHELSTSR